MLIHTDTHSHTHTCTHTRTRTHAHMHTRTHTQARMHARTHTCMHTHMRSHGMVYEYTIKAYLYTSWRFYSPPIEQFHWPIDQLHVSKSILITKIIARDVTSRLTYCEAGFVTARSANHVH